MTKNEQESSASEAKLRFETALCGARIVGHKPMMKKSATQKRHSLKTKPGK